MSTSWNGSELERFELADETIATVRRWLDESAAMPVDRSAARLAGVLKDPNGLAFAIGFVDRVVRPEDLRVAARNLDHLSRNVPAFLPWYLRFLIVLGGGLAIIAPWPIVPIARRVLRSMVGHLVIDATPHRLDTSLAHLRERGMRLNINLLGEAVLGDDEAERRLFGTRELLARPDVDYVSVKVSSVASQLSMWAFDETVDRVVERLTPLYELAASSPTEKFINLDMEEFRDLDLTVAVFKRLLSQPALSSLEAGIAVQAYLPDALAALQDLTAWAQARTARGGAGIKVRVVKGANLAMERVDATLHGWPLATYGSKRETDTNYKRVLNWALTAERTAAVRVGVAGHNLFDIAFAWQLAKRRGVTDRVDVEMLLGMATAQAEAVRADVGGLLLYTPVVHPREFDSAISYLVRRLEENASTENFMSAVFELADNEALFVREARRFRAALEGMDSTVPHSNRTQDRSRAVEAPRSAGFANEPDTDPSIAANRAWGRRILERSATSTTGATTLAAAKVTTAATLERRITATITAGDSWRARTAAQRASVLHDAGDVLAALRGRLIEVMASETGKTIAEADVEVSEAVDFAHYYAERAHELDAVENAEFAPSRLIVVTPPWNFPVAIPAGSVLAALATGAAVIIKPAPQARRCAAVLVEALHEAGVPADVVALIDVPEGALGKQLISHPAVGRVILTGAFETAQLFRSWRADLPLLAETSGKNAIVVTPSADLDLAAADIARSAFGHAGQKCSAASLAILVGTVASSDRFLRQLVDAVTSMRVGYPSDPRTQVGPIIEPASGKVERALTTLGEGERWLVEPRQLDGTGRLWSPGVRTGVAAGSEFHTTEYFGPVLGIMRAATLDEAIALQNHGDYGLTAGIHSLDTDEVAAWVDRVEAGNLYVNRGITGAIVRRQPFGGWKRSSVGTSAKAGGPNYLLTLGAWRSVETRPRTSLSLRGVSLEVEAIVAAAQSGIDFAAFDRVRSAVQSDQRAWATEYGRSADVSNLSVERNVFRYRPVPVAVRLAQGAPLGHLVRVIAAAARAGSTISVSSAVPLPAKLIEVLELGSAPVAVTTVTIESDAVWIARIPSIAANRIRLIGGNPRALADALGGSPDVAVYAGDVTTSGRIELLPFLREQAIAITAHRFGNPDSGFQALAV